MAVCKDKWNGYDGKKWRVVVTYKDWQGVTRRHEKRGFDTKREAALYETEFKAKMSRDINMSFATFVSIYIADLNPQLKETTLETKRTIIDMHILPYFEHKTLSGISPTDVLQWQNELLGKRDNNGKGYSMTYLRTIQNQLNAIFSHAVKYYDLPKNPCSSTKKMGKAKAPEMLFWTKDEYLLFRETMVSKPISYYCFEMLYWTGIRCGELLALTRKDFDFDKRTISINKQYQIVKGKGMIISPKTENSIRTVDLPQFLCDEIEDYIGGLYKLKDNDRLFPITKSYLHHELDRGCKEAGVKRIRVHDMRHSHVAYLINLGFSPVDIAERVGHESPVITLNTYSHLYPKKQKEMAERIDLEIKKEDEE